MECNDAHQRGFPWESETGDPAPGEDKRAFDVAGAGKGRKRAIARCEESWGA